jgi:hypothetical protein
MSSEQFDKHIRKKLESLQPPYQEQAWKNFKNLLPAPWYVTFFKTYSGWLYGSLCTLAVLSTSYLYYQQKEEIKQLHEEITTLKSEKLPEQNNNVTWTDSIPDKIKSDSSNRPQSSTKSHVTDTGQAPKLPEGKIALMEQPSPERQALTGSENTAKATNAQPRSSKEFSGLKQADNSRKLKNVVPNPGNLISTRYPGTEPTRADSTSDLGVRSSDKPAIGLNKSPDTLAAPTAKITALQNPDTTSVTPKETAKKKQERSRLWDLNWHLRLGLASDLMGFRKLAAGPTVELFLNDKLSLNTGLLLASQYQVRNAAPPDYNRVTGKRFEDVYQRHIPRHDGIREIAVKTSLIKMPVALNYYFPARSNFSFMVSGGTRLDLSAYQSVAFRSSYQGEERYNKFEAKPKPNTLNSLFYGIGGQYKYGRLVGQLTPYFNVYFREPDYFNAPRKFGLNASLKFDLKK